MYHKCIWDVVCPACALCTQAQDKPWTLYQVLCTCLYFHLLQIDVCNLWLQKDVLLLNLCHGSFKSSFQEQNYIEDFSRIRFFTFIFMSPNCFIFLMILNWLNFYMCFYFAPLILEILVPAVLCMLCKFFTCQKNIIWCKDTNFLNLFRHCDYGRNYLRTDAFFYFWKKRKERLMNVSCFACCRWAQLSTLNDLDRLNVMCVFFSWLVL